MSKKKEEIIERMLGIFYKYAEITDQTDKEIRNTEKYKKLKEEYLTEISEEEKKSINIANDFSNTMITSLLEVFSSLSFKNLEIFDKYLGFQFLTFSCNNLYSDSDSDSDSDEDEDDYDEDEDDSDVSVYSDSDSDSESEKDITPEEEFKIYLNENKTKK